MCARSSRRLRCSQGRLCIWHEKRRAFNFWLPALEMTQPSGQRTNLLPFPHLLSASCTGALLKTGGCAQQPDGFACADSLGSWPRTSLGSCSPAAESGCWGPGQYKQCRYRGHQCTWAGGCSDCSCISGEGPLSTALQAGTSGCACLGRILAPVQDLLAAHSRVDGFRAGTRL